MRPKRRVFLYSANELDLSQLRIVIPLRGNFRTCEASLKEAIQNIDADVAVVVHSGECDKVEDVIVSLRRDIPVVFIDRVGDAGNYFHSVCVKAIDRMPMEDVMDAVKRLAKWKTGPKVPGSTRDRLRSAA